MLLKPEIDAGVAGTAFTVMVAAFDVTLGEQVPLTIHWYCTPSSLVVTPLEMFRVLVVALE
jgi:hypothetical protein